MCNYDTYKPKVSIIVPVYNTERYVANCLDSLLAQTYRNVEIIAVNDGSTDGSREILDRYAKEKGVKVVVRPNGGLSAARNSGMEVATGEWLMFVDSDDAVHPELIERSMRIATETGVDFVRHEDRNVEPDRMMSFEAPPPDMSVQVFSNPVWYYIRMGLRASACVILYNAKAIGDLRFTHGIIFEDLDFNWRFLQVAKKGAHIKWAAYNYVQSENSITRSPLSVKKVESIGFIIRNIANHYRMANDRRLWLIRSTLFAITVKKQVLKPYLKEMGRLPEEVHAIVIKVVGSLMVEKEIGYWGFSMQWWPWLYKLRKAAVSQ